MRGSNGAGALSNIFSWKSSHEPRNETSVDRLRLYLAGMGLHRLCAVEVAVTPLNTCVSTPDEREAFARVSAKPNWKGGV